MAGRRNTAGYRRLVDVNGGRVGLHTSWESRLAWAGRPSRLRRPSQARRLDRADVRSSSFVRSPMRSRPSHRWTARPDRSGSCPPSRRRRAASPRSPPRWPPVWSPTAATVDVVRCGATPGDGGPAGPGDRSTTPRRTASAPPSTCSTAPTSRSSSTSTASTAAPTATRCSTCSDAIVVPSIVVAHTVVASPTREPARRARAGVRPRPTPSS